MLVLVVYDSYHFTASESPQIIGGDVSVIQWYGLEVTPTVSENAWDLKWDPARLTLFMTQLTQRI